MCADMSRIEWNKKKEGSNRDISNNSKKHKVLKPDCSSAQSFFNFLTKQ